MTVDCILDRIDAALEKVRARQMEVRAIYLTRKDHDTFDKAMRKRLKIRGSFLSYGDHQIRRGEHSIIYSTHGVGVKIPTNLSPRVRLAA